MRLSISSSESDPDTRSSESCSNSEDDRIEASFAKILLWKFGILELSPITAKP
jgi:hypothetical protein